MSAQDKRVLVNVISGSRTHAGKDAPNLDFQFLKRPRNIPSMPETPFKSLGSSIFKTPEALAKHLARIAIESSNVVEVAALCVLP